MPSIDHVSLFAFPRSKMRDLWTFLWGIERQLDFVFFPLGFSFFNLKNLGSALAFFYVSFMRLIIFEKTFF